MAAFYIVAYKSICFDREAQGLNPDQQDYAEIELAVAGNDQSDACKKADSKKSAAIVFDTKKKESVYRNAKCTDKKFEKLQKCAKDKL